MSVLLLVCMRDCADALSWLMSDYTGGLFDFVGFGGQNKYASGALNQFFTNSTIIGLYEDYISHWLNHVNQYTGVANKNEPTILALETGNELGAYMLEDGPPPKSWTQVRLFAS